MSLSLIPTGETALSLHSQPADITKTMALSPVGPLALTQPIADIASYLATRTPVPHFTREMGLFITLPEFVRGRVVLLLGMVEGGGMFGQLTIRLRHRNNVDLAVKHVAAASPDWCRSWQSLRRYWDRFAATHDWVAVVDRSRAGSGWIENSRGLPDDFLRYCATKFAAFKRWDGKRQALFALKRQWRTGRNERGELEPIPGYGTWQDWWHRHAPGRPLPAEAPIPTGWSYTNILSCIKARGLFRPAVRKLLHEGTSAARSELPTVRTTRDGLRFMELVQFDDVRCDFLVFDPASGQVVELWLLVARDLATSILLGFGMRPAKARDDGKQDHLKLRDMKQLCGWLLEAYGLPPYEMIWKLERGTATLSEGSARVLGELLPGRVKVSLSSMVGGKSSAGYFERRIGNSKGKASLESHNRLQHTMTSHLPGQIGNLYAVRPQDLDSRSEEAAETWALAQQLPANMRGQARFPVLTVSQAGAALRQIFDLQNSRTEHDLEGFESVLEWYDHLNGRWCPASALTAPPAGLQWRQRKESPVERAARLIAGHQWTRVSPDVIAAFFEHSARSVVVKNNGEITFRADGREFVFRCPPGGNPVAPETRLLAYFHPDDPLFLHLTDGHGRIVGTWLRRDRVAHHDQAAIAAAIRYSANALKEARAEAAALDSEPARLESMRADNARLLADHSFIAVADAAPRARMAEADSAVARVLSTQRRAVAREELSASNLDADIDAALAEAMR
jgi:hypothetical protein